MSWPQEGISPRGGGHIRKRRQQSAISAMAMDRSRGPSKPPVGKHAGRKRMSVGFQQSGAPSRDENHGLGSPHRAWVRAWVSI